MSRNWQASENPPRNSYHTGSHSPHDDPRDTISRLDGGEYVKLQDVPWPVVVTLAESIERWDRLNPIRRVNRS